jgi:hypothetical protein
MCGAVTRVGDWHGARSGRNPDLDRPHRPLGRLRLGEKIRLSGWRLQRIGGIEFGSVGRLPKMCDRRSSWCGFTTGRFCRCCPSKHDRFDNARHCIAQALADTRITGIRARFRKPAPAEAPPIGCPARARLQRSLPNPVNGVTCLVIGELSAQMPVSGMGRYLGGKFSLSIASSVALAARSCSSMAWGFLASA